MTHARTRRDLSSSGRGLQPALRDIGFDHYYQAETTGWVLYVEHATDLAILQTLADVLDHETRRYPARPFVKYVESHLPQRARDHWGAGSHA